jgi:hypothetical protein
MVANGLGLTLLPEISVAVDTRHGDIKLMRFVEPEPSRVVGLAWRTSNPRKRDFEAFAELILATVPAERHIAAPVPASAVLRTSLPPQSARPAPMDIRQGRAAENAAKASRSIT